MHATPVLGWSALALVLAFSPSLSFAQTPPPPVLMPRITAPTIFGGEAISRDALRAQFGYPVYQEVLGEYLLAGRSVIQDKALALAWLKTAAAQGSDGAENTLGRLYSGEEGITQDYAQAADWFRKAGDHGSGYSRYRLAMLYEKGLGVPQDDVQAYKWYVLATHAPGSDMYEDGTTEAVKRIARRLSPGQLAEAKAQIAAWKPLPPTLAQRVTDAAQTRDPQEALGILKPMAADGQPMAQYMLGLMYDHGQGVTRDYATAADWYRKAAVQGHVGAQIQLALLYINGKGVPKDYTAAAGWLQKASERNVAAAEGMLGQLYLDGKGVPQDKTVALAWLRKGADAGDASAQLVLAEIYNMGEDVPRGSGPGLYMGPAGGYLQLYPRQGYRHRRYFAGGNPGDHPVARTGQPRRCAGQGLASSPAPALTSSCQDIFRIRPSDCPSVFSGASPAGPRRRR